MMFRLIRDLRLSFVCLFASALLISMPAALAQNNQCDQPGESPDVIVGSLHQVAEYGSIGGISAYAVGTTSCNVGTCWLSWIDNTNAHPVIGQNNGTDISTGWLDFNVETDLLAAGPHTLTIGGYNNKKTTEDEVTWLRFDDLLLEDPDAMIPDGPDPADDGDDFDADGICDLGDADDDNDGVPDTEDCAPLDAGISAAPQPVNNTLLVEKLAGIVRITWTPGIEGDSSNIYAGSVLQPWSYNETCLASATAGSSYDDTPPAPGSAPTYYLISNRNSCGECLLGLDSSLNEHHAAVSCP